MIKLKDIVGLPSLQYHLDNDLTLHENVYRYSSESFIQLFTEARELWRDGYIQLNEEDQELIETTDIGLYGDFEGKKVPLDLPMVNEGWLDTAELEEKLNKMGYKVKVKYLADDDVYEIYSLEPLNSDTIFYDAKKLGFPNVRVYDGLDEAEYRGEKVALNKPKRGGPKKFYVYTKNDKGNVVKVNFGGTTGLNVKIDEPGARASFAARHQCDKKKDKTKPGYWACNIGRYWKSLGGKRNFSGYW